MLTHPSEIYSTVKCQAVRTFPSTKMGKFWPTRTWDSAIAKFLKRWAYSKARSTASVVPWTCTERKREVEGRRSFLRSRSVGSSKLRPIPERVLVDGAGNWHLLYRKTLCTVCSSRLLTSSEDGFRPCHTSRGRTKRLESILPSRMSAGPINRMR